MVCLACALPFMLGPTKLPLSQAVNGKVADLYRDPGHYTPRGHDLLAEILIKYIQERKLLELTLKGAK